MKASVWSSTSSRARRAYKPKTSAARMKRKAPSRAGTAGGVGCPRLSQLRLHRGPAAPTPGLTFARPETRHDTGSERAADGERGKGLPLSLEGEQQRRQPSGNEDE